jgi:hypothetical protein
MPVRERDYAVLPGLCHHNVIYIWREFSSFSRDEDLMRRSITIAIVVVMTSLLALAAWQVEVKATDTVSQEPEYDITLNSYLPIQRLQPLY